MLSELKGKPYSINTVNKILDEIDSITTSEEFKSASSYAQQNIVLNKLNIVKSIRGRSGKTYIVNEVFLKAEKLYEQSQIAVKPTQDSRLTTTLEETLYINNIGKIIKSHAGDRERILDELAKLPITELQEEKVNVYLCKQAIERKKDIERESKATYVNADKILGALKGLSKEKNFRYKQKKEYNIRNNIKPWEKNGR